MQSNYTTSEDPLSLERIRSVLVRLEETIIFGLIERSQFAHNPRMYTKGAFKELQEQGFDGSWLEWFLFETESFHAKARRYTGPDEHPFSPISKLPKPILPAFAFPKLLWENTVNVNPSILSFYVHAIAPRITRQATLALASRKRASGVTGAGEYEDDQNYGSAATLDVEILQAISKRVHYGMFVSESKFRENPAAFIPHILNPNPAKLDALITKPAVEKALLERLVKKAKTYGRDLGPTGEPVEGSTAMKIDAEGVRDLYESYIIPLTKEVEVDYLLQRLKGLTQEEIDGMMAQKK